MTLSKDDEHALESMIDRATLADVVHSLMAICHEKAEHIRANWQDHSTARPWDRAATTLANASDRIRKDGI